MLQKVVLLTWLLNWCFYHILHCNLEVYKQNPMDYIHSTLLELELHDLGQSGKKKNKNKKRKEDRMEGKKEGRKKNVRTSECAK